MSELELPEHVRRVEVLEVSRISPSFVRVVLGGPGMADFEPASGPDEACVFCFPTGDGSFSYDIENARWYTIRHVAPGRLTIDVVTHPGGVGASWARIAAVGDRLLLADRRSWFRRPDGATWQVLLGDVAALPAIARIAELSPPGLRTTAVIEVPSKGDRLEFTGPAAELTIEWVVNPALWTVGSRLGDLVRKIDLPDGPGYVYVAGESAATRDVRRYLRHVLRLPAAAYGIIGYWRLDAEQWRARFAESSVDLEALYETASAESDDEEEVLDIYEKKLAEIGLL